MKLLRQTLSITWLQWNDDVEPARQRRGIAIGDDCHLHRRVVQADGPRHPLDHPDVPRRAEGHSEDPAGHPNPRSSRLLRLTAFGPSTIAPHKPPRPEWPGGEFATSESAFHPHQAEDTTFHDLLPSPRSRTYATVADRRCDLLLPSGGARRRRGWA